MRECSLFLLSFCFLSCASSRVLGDPYRDSPKVEISQNDFFKLDFKPFPNGPVCDGPNPRSKLTYVTEFVPPVYQGAPSDTAVKETAELLAAIEDYLKNDFLYNASSPSLQDQNFSTCTDYRVNTGESAGPGVCWIVASNKSRNVLNRNVFYLKKLLLTHSYQLAAFRDYFTLMYPGGMPSSAINRRNQEWHQLFSSVHLEESDQEDGSIKYMLSLDMTKFCKYGMPTSDMVSK